MSNVRANRLKQLSTVVMADNITYVFGGDLPITTYLDGCFYHNSDVFCQV